MTQGASAQEGNWIKVGMSSCGIAAGADTVLNVLKEEAARRNIEIDILKCGCQGMCYAEPLVEVHVKGLPDVTYAKVDKQVALKIIDEHLCTGTLVKDHIIELRAQRITKD